MTRTSAFRLIQGASIALFFLQSLRVLFSVLFGIIYDGVFEGPLTPWLVLSNVLILIAFLVPSVVGRRVTGEHLGILVIVAGVARVGLSVNIPILRYWSSTLIIIAGLIYLVVLVKQHRRYFFSTVVLALCADQLLKVLGTTYDISLRPWWLPVQILWSLVIIWLSLQLKVEVEQEAPISMGIGEGLALGGFFYLQTSLFTLPNGLARWSGVSYDVIAPFTLAITAIFLGLDAQRFILRWIGSVPLRIVLVVVVCAGLALGYFFTGVMPLFLLLLAHAASLALIMMIGSRGESSRDRTGLSLTLGMFFFLILNFLNAFAFTYPYTLPALKGLGWAVYLAAGLSLFLLVRGWKPSTMVKSIDFRGLGLVPLVLAVAVSILAVWPVTKQDLTPGEGLRIATYNIHYGYDDPWHYTLEAIAETIEENDCDVVAMQEVDTGRLTSYGVDDALYLARRLRMNVLYLPTVEHLTGIAVLYRGTPVAEGSSLISSLQEQTGIVQVTMGEPEEPFHVFGIWMGLSDEDTHTQILEALSFIGAQTPAAFGGDFNAGAGSEVAAEIRHVEFSDPFETLAIDPAPNTSPAIDPENRIDFVWLRGLAPQNAWVADSLASDHRMVVVEVDFPE